MSPGHGTRTRYAYGCRCGICREANAIYQANRRLANGRVKATADGAMAVNCWCEATVVGVAREDLLAGRTGSCGRPGCHGEVAA